MPKALSILFGFLLTAASSWALGRMLLRRLPACFAREEEHLFAYVAGSAVLSLAIFLLAAAQALYDAVFLVAGILILAAAWKDGAFKNTSAGTLPPLPRLWRYTFWPVYTVFAAVLFIVAMSPEMSPDGSAYHLGIIARYYRHHGMERITTNLYASLSQGLEMLFLNAWAFGRHSAAALVHCSFLLVLPLLLLRFGQRFNVAGPAAAAGLFFLCSPVVMVDGASAYNDAAVACVLIAIFYLCELDAPPALAGLLAGFAFAIKYTAFPGLFYVLIRYALRRRWRAAAATTVASSVLILPWLARNWLLYRNPFSPLLNRFFPNPYVHLSFEQDYVELMRRYVGIESYWQLPLDLTVSGRLLGGFLGPLFLLAPIAVFALRRPLGRRVLLAALLFASTYATNIGTRFLIPALPFVSFAMALSIPAPLLPVVAVAHAALSFPDVPSTYIQEPGWRIARIPLRQALRIESEESWLSRKFPPYHAARLIEMATPPGAVVFTYSPIPDSYTTREVLASFQSARNERLTDLLQVALYPDFRPGAISDFRFPRQPLTAVRVLQTAAPAPSDPQSHDMWSISEFRVFDGDRELARASRWLLNARPNPWDIQLAFDNWPVTRWRSWARIRPGMFVEADFGAAETIDRLRLEMAFDQNGVRLAAEGRNPQGRWIPLCNQPVNGGTAPPLNLRRDAIQELRRDGVTHILTSQGDQIWDDFEKNPSLWGVRQVGALDGIRLYRLE